MGRQDSPSEASSPELVARRYRTLSDAAFEGVAVVEETSIIDANDQLAQMLGYESRDELIGEPIDIFLPPADVELIREQVRRSTDSHKDVVTLERQRCLCRDGSEILAEIRGKSLQEPHGPTSILVMRDVSEWKRAEQELERAYEDLEQFTRIVSHDLRSPLRALDNLSQWIAEDLGDKVPDETATHLELLQERVAHMDRLLEDLLRYARASGRDARLETIDLAETLRKAVATLDIGDSFEIHIDEQMPTFDTARAPLEQIFVNLITNAVEHHDRDRGRIEIGFERTDGRYLFWVRDDGPGIDPRFHDKIFEVFEALDHDNGSGGTGMGLSLVKRLVESSGGTIEVDSNPANRRGATFRFTWPIHWKESPDS